MTSKDELMKLFNDSSADREKGKQLEADNIKEFQDETRKLFIQMREWLDGTPVEIERNKTTIYDNTTSVGSYAIDIMTISNSGKRMELRPTALYLMGSTGEIEIKFTGTSRRNLQYSLYMKDSFGGQNEAGVWSLVNTSNRQSERTSLTKEDFYNLISNLA